MILHQNCKREQSSDKSLPLDSFIVTYMNDNEICHDIVQCNSQVEVFDYYHDNSHIVKSIEWTEGRVNPRFYRYSPKDSKKKKR